MDKPTWVDRLFARPWVVAVLGLLYLVALWSGLAYAVWRLTQSVVLSVLLGALIVWLIFTGGKS